MLIFCGKAMNSSYLLSMWMIPFSIGVHLPWLIMWKSTLHQHFNTTNLGLLRYFLWLQITQSASRIGISQPKYTLGSLKQISHVGLQICTPCHFCQGASCQPSVPFLWLMLRCISNSLAAFCTKLIFIPISPMQLGWFPSSCKNHMSFIESWNENSLLY